jgi:hypothetical protein
MAKYKPSIDLGHIGEIHALDRALQERGEENGIHPHIVELISRLTSGGVAGKSDDLRHIQAKRLWDRGFGRELEFDSFDTYLATIPEIPARLLEDDPELPLLSLADPRLGLIKACELIGIKHEEFSYTEGDAVPWDERHKDLVKPFWLRHNDGRTNRNRRPDHCRDECTGDILAGTALVGIMAYLHHPEIIVEDEHVIDLPGSVHRDGRVHCAYLGVWGGRVELDVCRGSDIAYPDCGSLRLRWK